MIDKQPSLTEGQLLAAVIDPWREFSLHVEALKEQEQTVPTTQALADFTEREGALNVTVARALFALVNHWDTHGAMLVNDDAVVTETRKRIASVKDQAAFLTWLDTVAEDAAEVAEQLRASPSVGTSKHAEDAYRSFVLPGREQLAPFYRAAGRLTGWQDRHAADALHKGIRRAAAADGLLVDDESWTTSDGATMRSVTLEAPAPATRRPWWRFWSR